MTKLSSTFFSVLGFITLPSLAQEGASRLIPDYDGKGLQKGLAGAGAASLEKPFYNKHNPALHAFGDKTLFTGSLEYQEKVSAVNNPVQSSVRLSQFAFLFPMKLWANFALGASYEEDQFINYEISSTDSAKVFENGSLNSLNPSFSVKYSNFGLGATAHLMQGNAETDLRIPIAGDEAEPFRWLSENTFFKYSSVPFIFLHSLYNRASGIIHSLRSPISKWAIFIIGQRTNNCNFLSFFLKWK